MRPLALRWLTVACLSLVGFGCAASSPAREQSMDSAGAAEGGDAAQTPRKAEPPSEPDLSPDPYRKVPSGKGGGREPDSRTPAAFTPPSAEAEPSARPLQTPTRLAVSFVRKGRFVLAARELLRLEASLAEAPGLREVLGHPLPRGAPRDLRALGRETSADLLLVVSLPPEAGSPPGEAWLVHCQDPKQEPALLAHFDPPPAEERDPPENAAFTSDEPDSLANLVARIALAHRRLRRPR